MEFFMTDRLKHKPHISVIIPAFNEGAGIGGLIERIRVVLQSLDEYHEIIIIDDGSFILLIVDRVKSSMFIERVINKFAANMFESSNLEVVTDEEFKAYYDFFVANGLYQQEKKVSISKDEIIGSRR